VSRHGAISFETGRTGAESEDIEIIRARFRIVDEVMETDGSASLSCRSNEKIMAAGAAPL
jgi:hypothetical protein